MIHPTFASVAWIGLVSIGLAVQVMLRDEAIRDITAVMRTPIEFLPPRVSQSDMLAVTHRARQRATTHLVIKVFGVIIGVWSLFVPPAPGGRELFTQAVSIYLLLMMASLDVEGIRDLWIRRALLSDGTFLPNLRDLFKR